MRTPKRFLSAFYAVVGVLCLACAAAQGQVIEVVDDDEVIVGVKDRVDARAQLKVVYAVVGAGQEKIRVVLRTDGQRMAIVEVPLDEFDQQLFRGASAETVRAKLEKKLESRLAKIDQDYQLTPAQTQKLNLAGRMEIQRLFAEIEARRREFERVRQDGPAALRVIRNLGPLRLALTDASAATFQENSLLDKVLQTTLTPDQLARHDGQREERRLTRQAGLQRNFLRMLEKQGPLADEQRERLIRLLDEARLPNPRSADEDNGLWEFVNQIPEEKFREILDARQWEHVQSQFRVIQELRARQRQARNMGLPAEVPVRPANGLLLKRIQGPGGF